MAVSPRDTIGKVVIQAVCVHRELHRSHCETSVGRMLVAEGEWGNGD